MNEIIELAKKCGASRLFSKRDNFALMGNDAIAAFYERAKAQGFKEGRDSLGAEVNNVQVEGKKQ